MYYLSIDDIISILNDPIIQSKEINLWIKSSLENILIYNIELEDKIYYKQLGKSVRINELKNNYDKIIDETLDIDLLVKLKQTKEKINLTTLHNKIDQTIKEIEEELELIQSIIIFNKIFLKHGFNKEKVDLYINYLILGLSYPLGTILKPSNKYLKRVFSERQLCLFQQVLDGCIYYKTEKNSLHYTEEFKEYLKYIKLYIPSSSSLNCKYVENYKSPCFHKTFHYYTFKKWISLFCDIYNKLYPAQNCIFGNIVTNPHLNLIYPNSSFCIPCRGRYKSLQSDLNTDNNSNEFIITKLYKNEVVKFQRIRFSNNCDITKDNLVQHTSQINTLQISNNKLITQLVNQIRKEVQKFESFNLPKHHLSSYTKET